MIEHLTTMFWRGATSSGLKLKSRFWKVESHFDAAQQAKEKQSIIGHWNFGLHGRTPEERFAGARKIS